MSETYRMVTTVHLPTHGTPAEQLARVQQDVEAATAEAKVKIIAHYQKRYGTAGYTIDDDSWEMVYLPEQGGRKIVVTATCTRPD